MVDSAVRWMPVESSGERWKARCPLASEDVEHGGFCGAVDAGGEQWKVDYPPTSRDMEHGGFAVRWMLVDAGRG
jgi:hypothetical protein